MGTYTTCFDMDKMVFGIKSIPTSWRSRKWWDNLPKYLPLQPRKNWPLLGSHIIQDDINPDILQWGVLWVSCGVKEVTMYSNRRILIGFPNQFCCLLPVQKIQIPLPPNHRPRNLLQWQAGFFLKVRKRFKILEVG